MILNKDEILNEGLIMQSPFSKPAQVGIDLSVKEIYKINNLTKFGDNNVGIIPVGGSTRILEYTRIGPNYHNDYYLEPDYYQVFFNEGCKIPNDRVGFIVQRSSLLRNGGLIHSSIFDPGFETQSMGTFMLINKTIYIEQNARIAQMYFFKCNPLNNEDLYNGQYQNDKQKKD